MPAHTPVLAMCHENAAHVPSHTPAAASAESGFSARLVHLRSAAPRPTGPAHLSQEIRLTRIREFVAVESPAQVESAPIRVGRHLSRRTPRRQTSAFQSNTSSPWLLSWGTGAFQGSPPRPSLLFARFEQERSNRGRVQPHSIFRAEGLEAARWLGYDGCANGNDPRLRDFETIGQGRASTRPPEPA